MTWTQITESTLPMPPGSWWLLRDAAEDYAVWMIFPTEDGGWNDVVVDGTGTGTKLTIANLHAEQQRVLDMRNAYLADELYDKGDVREYMGWFLSPLSLCGRREE